MLIYGKSPDQLSAEQAQHFQGYHEWKIVNKETIPKDIARPGSTEPFNLLTRIKSILIKVYGLIIIIRKHFFRLIKMCSAIQTKKRFCL